MKVSVATLVIAALLSLFTSSSATVGAESDLATVHTMVFDPPAQIDEYNWLTKIIVVTNIPGSPNVVLHIPCIRSRVSPNNSIAAGGVVGRDLVEGCRMQRIPTGRSAGSYVNGGGEIITPPNG